MALRVWQCVCVCVCITQELDELEREDFTRLKKVVSKKNDEDDDSETETGKFATESLASASTGPSALDVGYQ